MGDDRREHAKRIVAGFHGPEAAERMENPPQEIFGGELMTLALDNVFGDLWGRPGLSLRERSLVTLGALIALRANAELRMNISIALKTGITPDELAEVIYQTAGYAGFPAASAARTIAADLLAERAAEVSGA